MPAEPPNNAPPAPEELFAWSTQRAARHLCRHLVERAARAIEAIGSDGPDGVAARHELRVTLRQLRVTLVAYSGPLSPMKPAKLSRRIASLARRIGPARNRDVHRQLLQSLRDARSSPQRAALDKVPLFSTDQSADALDCDAIRRRWEKLERQLRDAITTWTEEQCIDEPSSAISFRQSAADALDDATRELARRCAAISTVTDTAQMHSARLALKRARYLLAPLVGDDAAAAMTLQSLREAQGLFGTINDASGFGETISESRHGFAMAGETPSRATTAALDAAERDLTARIAQAFQRLASWREPTALLAHIESLHAITARWRRIGAPPMEYERKWLLSGLPPRVRSLTPAVLRQGYLPGEALVERIRRVTERGRTTWIRTVKLGRGAARIEVEEPVSARLGTALFALTKGARVGKKRYAVTDGALTWEIDEFTDRDLVLAEVEFPDANTTVEFPVWLAPWIVREVTDDIAFTNWKLAR